MGLLSIVNITLQHQKFIHPQRPRSPTLQRLNHMWFLCAIFRGRPGKPNQRKADSQAGSRIWGVFVNSACFFLQKKPRRIHKNRCSSRVWGVLGILPFFFRKRHSKFTKTPQIREPACESAFLSLVCLGDPWNLCDVIPTWRCPNIVAQTLKRLCCLCVGSGTDGAQAW